jgi:peroxiredoxin
VEAPLRELGIRLIAISPDHPANLRASQQKHELGYTLLSDRHMRAARAFGIAWQVSAAEVAQLAEYGIDLEAASGETHHVLPVPSVFLVDAAGRIRWVYSNPDYKIRPDNVAILEAARGLEGAGASG